MDYRGMVVVVTGASSGIGNHAARAFARRGATVVGVARREERLRELVEACRGDSPESSYRAGDLGERDFAESVVNETAERYGRLDVLVNNAALSSHKPIYRFTPEDVERLLRVNFLACVWTTLAALPQMLRQGGGTLVNVSSFAAKITPPREAAYAASKAAMSAFTEGLWHDLAGSEIHAGLVVPGPIDTEIWDKDEEPTPHTGRKHPPSVVTDAIFEVIEKRRHEIVAPRRHPALVTGRFMRLCFPGLMRYALAKTEPVPPQVVEEARERARQRLAPTPAAPGS